MTLVDAPGPSPAATTGRDRGSMVRHLGRAVAVGSTAGASGVAYGWLEARWFRIRHATVPVLPPGAAPLRVLHLTDVHLTPYQRRKRAWLASLADLRPDLVVSTGDSLSHRDAVTPFVEGLGDLTTVPGAFVLGSNDYYAPRRVNPARYLLPDDGSRRTGARRLPFADLVARLRAVGWTDLSNRRSSVTVRGVRIALAGVDDPHMWYDDLEAVAGPADPDADLRLAVSHAPYLRVLDQFAADGYDLVLAGHTHGGQLCLPGGRALVTNCDIDRERARGLHRHPAHSRPGDPGSCWLHVSAGAGTSPYAVARVCCRPEAVLLHLVPRDA